MNSLSFFPLISATTTASSAPVYHGGMIPVSERCGAGKHPVAC